MRMTFTYEFSLAATADANRTATTVEAHVHLAATVSPEVADIETDGRCIGYLVVDIADSASCLMEALGTFEPPPPREPARVTALRGLDGSRTQPIEAAESATLPSGRAGRTGPGHGLTRRETEVLLLVSEGMSNRAIAERLFLSPRTVEKHVERLLTKTGTTNRAHLVSYTLRPAAS